MRLHAGNCDANARAVRCCTEDAQSGAAVSLRQRGVLNRRSLYAGSVNSEPVRIRHARTAEFLHADQHDLGCPVLFAKIIPFASDPNQNYNPRRLVPLRGVSRSSRTRDGMRWTLMVLLTNST